MSTSKMSAVLLPELGEGIKQATVACWHVKEGDSVAADQDLVEVVTDKATFAIPAPVSGVIEKILIPEGQNAAIGDSLAMLA